MPIEKINTSVAGMPPAWISRTQGRSTPVESQPFELRRLLGEPIPQVVDPKHLTPHIAAFFRKNGVLERIRKKLELISRKKGGHIFPAKNTIAAVDEDHNVYVGIEFLEKFGENEDLLAGILAHEWGHMLSDRPFSNNSPFSLDELLALRREEEAQADAFSGRALYLLRYDLQPMIDFLQVIDRKRKSAGLQTHKYHNTATRVEILRESFLAVLRSMDVARRIFSNRNHGGPNVGWIIGAG